MQKLLIHINILLAFSVLFCSHSAFGQSVPRVYIDDFSAGYGADRKAVDLGLNVYWASKNVGASGPNDYGTYFTWSEASTWNSSHNYPNWGGEWRTPKKSELEKLKNLQQSRMTANPGGVRLTSSNGYFIDIPASGWYDKHGTYGGNGLRSYLWSSTQWDIWPYDRAYYLIYYDTWPYDLVVYTGDKDSKLPIRPVIDKVTITVTTAGANPIQKSYPKGTKIKIGAFMDECHKVAYWTKSSISESGTVTPNNTSGDNGDIEIFITEDVTYTAFFSTKTTNVKATTEDDQKGTVEILEPINN